MGQRFSEGIGLSFGGSRLVALGLEVPFEIFVLDLYAAAELYWVISPSCMRL